MTAYGGRDLYSSREKQDQDMRFMRAGVFPFIATFTITVLLAVVTLLKVRDERFRTERAVAVCAILVVPFMTVRLASSAGSHFSGQNSVLSPLSKQESGVWLHFVMVVVMEYVVVLAATAVALCARRGVVVEDEKMEREDDV